MNNILGDNIARLRKEKGMTQEELARELNISYQAVSKWENGVSSPDISNIKLLAQFFGVSIDMLFGLELMPEKAGELPAFADTDEAGPAPEAEPERLADEVSQPETVSGAAYGEEAALPWEDDDTLRAVLFKGRQLVSAEKLGKGLFGGSVRLEYSGEALNVFSFFDVDCESVRGNVEAGGDVDCAEVGGNVSASGDIDCGSVSGSVSCGGDADCDDVGGDLRAGGDVNCGTVIGSVSTGGDVNCGNVGGNLSAGGDVCCGIVRGNVYRG
ncbi:MAG: helix-turn-helix domain-containing protein [Oscillospiraceae bacterium]|nr:helix-turn-helix domain-containing protein [Oscillospiraceae bacterium]